MTGQAPQMHPVRRRAVFHIPGFDPMPPRTYRERYRREAARQAEHSGHSITVTPAKTPGAYGWHVAARIEGEETTTDIELLHWADIVRASMEGGVLATYGQLLRTAWVYLGSGALFRLMRLRKGPLIAALYPVVMLLLQLAAAALAGIVVVLALLRAGEALGMAGAAGLGLAVIAGLGAGALILRLFRRRDPLLAWYLMHDYAFTASMNGAYPPVQEARMAAFADRIAAALASDFDEVLVVGHSSGGAYRDLGAGRPAPGRARPRGPAGAVAAHAGPSRADGQFPARGGASAWRSGGAVAVRPAGLGSMSPRPAMAVASRSAIRWRCRGMTAPGKRWPLVLSAVFSKTLSPEAWRALRWRFFERHFQYLNAFDNLPDDPGAYDYFAVTAGPQTLAARFAARRPSASRIERAVNPYAERAA